MNENTQLHNAGYISDIFLISISPKRISYISCDAESLYTYTPLQQINSCHRPISNGEFHIIPY